MRGVLTRRWTGALLALTWGILPSLLLHEAFAEDPPKPEAAYWTEEATRQFFTELEARHGGDKPLAAAFDQEKHLRMLKTPLAAEGRICFAPPGHLRFEITRPFRSVLLYNGGNIQRFEQEDGKWKALDTHAVRVMVLVMEQISQWMQGKFEMQSPVFDTRVVSAPEQGATVQLCPKHERFREFIERIDIGVGPPPERAIQRITVREPGGDYTEMKFTREQRDAALPGKVFEAPDAPMDSVLPEKAAKP